nr:MAG TPA: hypothetical protein [Caudoviricetes sp.]
MLLLCENISHLSCFANKCNISLLRKQKQK